MKSLIAILAATFALCSIDDIGPRFLTRLNDFRRQLDSSQEERFTKVLLKREPQNKIDSPKAKWLPVECKVLKIYPEHVSTIHEGKRNNVYLMIDPLTGIHYAHKTFGKPDEYTAELNAAMFTADHPFIAKAICIHSGKDENSHTIAGILFEHVDGYKSNRYAAKVAKPDDIERISWQLLDALQYLHYVGFVHADLKPENVLIDRNGNVKMIDFGFAIPLPHYKTGRGTSSTMAPELIEATHGAVHEGIDWWAYGSTVAIWTGANLKRSASKRFIPMHVNSKHSTQSNEDKEQVTFGTVPDRMRPELKEMLYLFFDPNPERRRFNTLGQLDFLKSLPYFSSLPEKSIYAV